MPEPYPFPKLPEGTISFPEGMKPISLRFSGHAGLVMTPPVEETNFISYFLQGSRELFRWALVVDDSGKVVPITEDGKVTDLTSLVKLAFRLAMGSVAYEKCGMDEFIEKNAHKLRG